MSNNILADRPKDSSQEDDIFIEEETILIKKSELKNLYKKMYAYEKLLTEYENKQQELLHFLYSEHNKINE